MTAPNPPEDEEPVFLPADFVIELEQMPTRWRKAPEQPGFIDDEDFDPEVIPDMHRTAGWREILGALPGETMDETVKRISRERQ
ncbi:hypothetical protein [Candidatus Methylomirabilis sp.]|uniref:hypothetical protein n=1 Tax=Candidatus Methylomirabilis sp. TaxID=2032687 RepID=UPI003C727FF8